MTKRSRNGRKLSQPSATPNALEPRSDKKEPVPKTILVVDDEEAIRVLICHALKKSGYSVLQADSFESALQVWEIHGHGIDMLLTDIRMPGKSNGLDLAHCLKAQNPKLGIALMSGYCSEYFGGPAPRPEFFLQKPFSGKALLGMVKDCLASA